MSNIKIAEFWDKTEEIWKKTAEIWKNTAEFWEKTAEIWEKSQISKVRKSGKITRKFGNFKICLQKSGNLSIFSFCGNMATYCGNMNATQFEGLDSKLLLLLAFNLAVSSVGGMVVMIVAVYQIWRIIYSSIIIIISLHAFTNHSPSKAYFGILFRRRRAAISYICGLIFILFMMITNVYGILSLK
jgi:hypothetical protein